VSWLSPAVGLAAVMTGAKLAFAAKAPPPTNPALSMVCADPYDHGGEDESRASKGDGASKGDADESLSIRRKIAEVLPFGIESLPLA